MSEMLQKSIGNLSPEQLARLSEKLREKKGGNGKTQIEKRKNLDEYPMSSAQKRLWFLNQVEKNSAGYNIFSVLRLEGNLSKEALEKSLNMVVERHEVLRACFLSQDNDVIEMIAPKLTLTIGVTDLTDLNETEKKKSLDEHVMREGQKPFDLSRPPLLRASLLKLNPAENILVLSIHHIVADGWSTGLLLSEMMAFYRSYVNGTIEPPVEELKIQYADYAAWEQEYIKTEAVDKQLSFWIDKLKGMPQTLELPVGRHRPAVKRYKGERFNFTTGKEVRQALLNISQQQSSTLFMTLLSAFQVFLYRITGQEDFGIGIPSANRMKREVENLIGLFVNTLVIRTDISSRPSFSEVIRRTKNFTAEAFDNQDVPFEKIVEAVQTSRNLSVSPLFQVMFDLVSFPSDMLRAPELTLSPVDIDNGTSKFDLLLTFEDTGGILKGVFEYDSDLFDRSSIAEYAKAFQTLLTNMAFNPDKPACTLPLVSKDEENNLQAEVNNTRAEYPLEANVASLFEQTALSSPEYIAVKEYDKVYTYKDLDEQSNRLARYLLKSGAGFNTPVAVFMERSYETIISMLAILKAGAIYVPLDTGYPKARLGLMLADLNSPLIITEKNLSDLLPETKCPTLLLGDLKDRIEKEESASLNNIKDRHEVTSSDIAYIIYTSGSTGLPKGVAVTHRGILRLVLNTNYIKISEGDRIAHISNVAFDAATFEIWGALLNRATAVVINKDDLLSIRKFAGLLRDYKITSLFITTALFNQIINEDPGAFASLKNLLFGGEAADIKTVRKILGPDMPEHLSNIYGPTECTTFSTYYRVDNLKDNIDSIPIGKPISNSTAYILDKHYCLVPKGLYGELCLGGDGLADRYINNPELTAQKFIPDPFSTSPGKRIYRTGDMVRYQEDGNIEFIGRIDNQVKLRGFRIEPGEIEAAIKEHPSVRDAVVLLKEDKPGNKLLTGYLIEAGGNKVETRELKKFLSRKIPEYMIPVSFVIMERFPVTPNGKIDKDAFPEPLFDTQNANAPAAAPRTKLESYLAGLWEEILQVKNVGIYDNFFELGGNSIQAAVFMNRIQKQFNIESHLKAVFLAPTVAELAVYINEYYPELARKIFGEDELSDSETVVDEGFLIKETTEGKITDVHVEELRRIIKDNSSSEMEVSGTKNRKTVFILSPPRSGSTLFRVMLAGNPKLFSPPELELLTFRTLKERKEALKNRYSLWLEATIRAIMELKNVPAREAELIMSELEEKNISVKDFYGILQSWAGDKLLVDKTPSYSLDPEILKRAEDYFEDPVYIHLVRHPYASVYSFIEAKLDQNFFRYPNSFKSRELAEMIYIISHENIATFLNGIDDKRKYTIRFEDLVEDPEKELRKLCTFLDIEFNSDMLKPYEGQKMTDSVRENSQMVGDHKFYIRRTIDVNVKERWRKFHFRDFLSSRAWNVALNYGYQKEEPQANETGKELRKIESVDRNQALKLSYSQQRLWFLDQLDPNNSFYNISSALRITGTFDETILRKSLHEIVQRHEILRTTFPQNEGRPEVKIHESVEYGFRSIDLNEYNQSSEEIIKQETERPFNLSEGPLLRVMVIKEKENKHLLIITMHHIISDGWSVGIFFKEITELYDTFRNERLPELKPLEVQYVDYAYWQKETLEGEKLKSQSDYWLKRLDGITQMISLPLDFPRPKVMQHNGNRIFHKIDEDLYRKINDLGNKNSVTSFVFLISAFQVLLYKYSGQNDICIGTPVAGRNTREIEDLIGFFANTIVLRGNISGTQKFSDLLTRTQSLTLEGLSNQDIPFEKLVDLLQPERDMSYTPLFQVMFSHNKTQMELKRYSDLELIPVKLKSSMSKFDLLVEVTEKDNSFKIEFEYNTALFKESTIERMAGHFHNLLEDIFSAPDKMISELSILSENEYPGITAMGLGESRQFNSHVTFPILFEEQVKLSPYSVAVNYEGYSITYSELNRRANQLAGYLRKAGLGPERYAVICLGRSIELITSIIAVLKTGGAYIPLDPLLPKERIDTILNEIPDALIITEKEFEGLFRISSTNIISLERDKNKISYESDGNHPGNIMPENAAYMIFTSGSTGAPKGVVIEHGSLINLYYSLKEKVYSEYEGRKLNISLNAPVHFDASLQQIVMMLDGHSLFVLPQEIRGSGSDLLIYVRKYKIEVLDCVPTQLKLMIDEGLFREEEFKPLLCLPGGEAIDLSTWKEITGQSAISFFNMYGPTECTVDSAISNINGEKPDIGRAVYNTSFYILDNDLNPVPNGIQGELYIGGIAVGRGYFNHPELTAEKFIPNPFSISGERLYRTGDLGRYLEDGKIEYLGRTDHQVKIRGFRIEIREIENHLRTHPLVKETIVDVLEDSKGNKKLISYLICLEETDTKELRAYLKNRLPDYMIPSFFVFVKEFPKTVTGKIDRKKLPAFNEITSVQNESFQEAASEEEQMLTEIWKQVLALDKVGVEDNFFELGGDSITSIQVIAKANHAGIKLTPKDIFLHPTVRSLALVSKGNTLSEVEQKTLSGEIPLSPIQKWFFEQNFIAEDHWTQSNLFKVNRKLNAKYLSRALDEILKHHDMLRASFKKDNNEIKQEISGTIKGTILNHIVRNQEITNKILADEIKNIFDSFSLSKGNLIKAFYLEEEGNKVSYLFISIHHLIIDSVSWRILLNDLWTLYNQLENKLKLSLPLKTASYKSYIEYMERYSASGALEKDISFWMNNIPREEYKIPVDFMAGENTEESLCIIQTELPDEQTEILLHRIHGAYDIKMSEVLIAALYLTLTKWSGNKLLYLNMENHGRDSGIIDIDISRTIGWFTSLYPLKLQADNYSSSKQDNQDDLKEITGNLVKQLRSIPSGGLSFGILKYLSKEDDVKSQFQNIPQPEISFNYLGQFNMEKQGDIEIVPGHIFNDRNPLNKRTHLLDISAVVIDRILKINFGYSKNRHSDALIREIAERYIKNITELIGSILKWNKGFQQNPGNKQHGLNRAQYQNLLDELDEE